MSKVFCVVLSAMLALGMACLTIDAESVIEDPDKIDSYNSECGNDHEWYESETGTRAWPHTYMVENAHVGQELKEKFIVRNFTDEARSYTISPELMDNENRYAWLPGDGRAVAVDKTRIVLKPKEKAVVTVTVKVQKNHSANAYFHIDITPDKGPAKFLVLDIAQFDSKEDVMSTKPPAMFKTLGDALKNKTKLGRMVKKHGRVFLVYGNIHIFSFDEATGKFQWHYNHKYTIVDLTVLENYVFTHSDFLDIKTGTETYCGESHWLKYIYDGKVYVLYGKNRCEDDPGSSDSPSMPMDGRAWDQLVCKKYLTNEVLWQTLSTDSFWGMKYPFVMPNAPGKLFVRLGAYEFFNDRLMCLDANSGKVLFTTGSSHPYIRKDDLGLLIVRNQGGLSQGNENIEIWDVTACKRIYYMEACGATEFHDAGRIFYFADFKCSGAYDYVSGKLLWRQFGDGAILAKPALDGTGKFLYILDEDSKWKRGEDAQELVSKPQYVRLFKLEAATGRLVWKTALMKLPKDVESFFGSYGSDSTIEFDGGKVKVLLDSEKYKFTLRASDGKFVR